MPISTRDLVMRNSKAWQAGITSLLLYSLSPAHAAQLSIEAGGSARSSIDPLVVNGFNQSTDDSSLSDTIQINVKSTGPSARTEFGAAATAGSVAAAVRNRVTGPYSNIEGGIADVDANAYASATFIINDLIFDGPGSTVETESILEVSGNLIAETITSSAGSYAVAFGSVTVSVNLQGPGLNFSASGEDFLQSEREHGVFPNVTSIPGGAFVGQDLTMPLSFGQVTVPTNTPITMEVTLSVSGGAILDSFGGSAPYDAAASGDSLFGSTVNFPIAGAAFLLGTGESVNSVSAELVNNLWTGTPLAVTLVPIPSALALTLAPLFLLRKRKKPVTA